MGAYFRYSNCSQSSDSHAASFHPPVSVSNACRLFWRSQVARGANASAMLLVTQSPVPLFSASRYLCTSKMRLVVVPPGFVTPKSAGPLPSETNSEAAVQLENCQSQHVHMDVHMGNANVRGDLLVPGEENHLRRCSSFTDGRDDSLDRLGPYLNAGEGPGLVHHAKDHVRVGCVFGGKLRPDASKLRICRSALADDLAIPARVVVDLARIISLASIGHEVKRDGGRLTSIMQCAPVAKQPCTKRS
jgi:hypothetical protein